MTLYTSFCSILLIVSASQTDPVVFHADFDEPNPLMGWAHVNGEIVEGYEGTPSLFIENDKAGGSPICQCAVPAERIAGKTILIEATIKTESLTKRPNTWNGVKVMLTLDRPEGARDYPQISLTDEDHDWQSFQRVVRVPKDVKAARLTLGLEKVTGKVWFDNVEVRLARRPGEGRRSKTMFKAHDEPRLRGVMHGPNFKEEDIRYLAEEWGANQIRWQLTGLPMTKPEEWEDLERYDRWLEMRMKQADQAADACAKYGIHMLLDLHVPPGGRAKHGTCHLFREKRYQDKLVEVWKRLATRYKGHPAIYAYDILNEPVGGAAVPGVPGWNELATKVIKTIREIDPGKPIVFEPSPWSGPPGYDLLTPLDLDRIIYSVHMYIPHPFTHQGVRGTKLGAVYPGRIGNDMWDKEQLREALMPAIEFQEAFNVPVYVGEFSAIRWAPDNSAYRYISDLIDLFEEYGWDWSYHAYREWEGWSVEHGPDQNNKERSATRTDREKLLRSWFTKNSEKAGSNEKRE